MTNYYSALGIANYCDSQDIIREAYKSATERLRSMVLDKDVKSQLIALNEAYLVLSDTELKSKYDYALSNPLASTSSIDADISIKHQKASDFIENKLAGTKKRKKKRIWPAILCGFFLLSAVGTIVRTCSQAAIHEMGGKAETLGSYNPSANWTTYEIDNSISISVPNSMELRNDFDIYTRFLSDNNLALSNAEAIFQQKDLSNMSSEGYSTYARIIVQHFSFGYGDEVEHHYESPGLVAEDYKNLREMVDAEILPYEYVDKPTWRWIEVNGAKIIEGSYRRSGDKGPVVCHIYLMCNYDEMVKLIVSYRESDKTKWENDLNNVIRTFRWNNPH